MVSILVKQLNEDYVSGLSITYSSNPRQHIWTFAGGDYEKSSGPHSCPCTSSKGFAAPSFVGNNYYCKSGAVNSPPSSSYFLMMHCGTEQDVQIIVVITLDSHGSIVS